MAGTVVAMVVTVVAMVGSMAACRTAMVVLLDDLSILYHAQTFSSITLFNSSLYIHIRIRMFNFEHYYTITDTL
jgi:hypothetical protein